MYYKATSKTYSDISGEQLKHITPELDNDILHRMVYSPESGQVFDMQHTIYRTMYRKS